MVDRIQLLIYAMVFGISLIFVIPLMQSAFQSQNGIIQDKTKIVSNLGQMEFVFKLDNGDISCWSNNMTPASILNATNAQVGQSIFEQYECATFEVVNNG